MDNSPFVVLRDTISKQTDEYTPEQAQQWLDHPVFGLRLEVVNTAKPEVLSAPFIFDADGEKHLIEDHAIVVEEEATPAELAVDYNEFTKADLVAQIEDRNATRDEADHLDASGVKADLVNILVADDANLKESN